MKKSPLLAVCIVVLLLFTACGSKFSDIPESSTSIVSAFGNSESLMSIESATGTEATPFPSSSPTPAPTAIPDFSSYAGVWFTEAGSDDSKNSSSGEVSSNGGLILQINEVRDDYIRFKVECISAPPANRVAEASVEAELKSGKADFVFKDDGWGNTGSGRLELQVESVSLTITAFDSADTNWGMPSQGQFDFVRDNSRQVNSVAQTRTIKSPAKDNYRAYLAQFGITGSSADDVIRLNNYIIENGITSEKRVKELRDSYDLPDEVKLLDELVPIGDGGDETAVDSSVTSQPSEQIDSRVIGCWFGYNINEERFAYRFDKSGKVTIAYIDAVFYGTTRYITIDGLLYIESLENAGAMEYAYSFDDKGLILGSVDLDGENAKALESIPEEKFNGLLQLIDEYK